MQKLADGFLYDTEKATKICTRKPDWLFGEEYSDYCEMVTDSIWITPNGRFFRHRLREPGKSNFFLRKRLTGEQIEEIAPLAEAEAWDLMESWGLPPDATLFHHEAA